MIPREDNQTQDCCLVKVYQKQIKTDDYDNIIKEEDKCISSFYVKNFSEFITTMWFCKENGVPVFFNDYDNEVERYCEKNNNPIFSDTISDIWITMPTKVSIMCINISI